MELTRPWSQLAVSEAPGSTTRLAEPMSGRLSGTPESTGEPGGSAHQCGSFVGGACAALQEVGRGRAWTLLLPRSSLRVSSASHLVGTRCNRCKD